MDHLLFSLVVYREKSFFNNHVETIISKRFPFIISHVPATAAKYAFI